MKRYGYEGRTYQRAWREGPSSPRTKPNGYFRGKTVWNRLSNADKYERAKTRRRERVIGRRVGKQEIEAALD